MHEGKNLQSSVAYPEKFHPGGGGGGYNGGMDTRISKLETAAESTRDTLNKIDVRLAVIEKTMATKSDLSEAKSAIVMWVVGAFMVSQALPPIIKILNDIANK